MGDPDPEKGFDGLTDQQKQDAAKKLGDAMADPSTQQDLATQIKNLTGVANAVDQAFSDVEGRLNRVSTNDISDRLAKDIAYLRTTWSKYRQDFINLIWQSRYLAGHAEFLARDFSSTVLKYSQDTSGAITMDIKLEMCKEYDSFMSKQVDAAAQISQDFHALSQNVQNFKEEWAQKCKDDLDYAEKQEKARQDELNRQITSATDDLKTANDWITKITGMITQQKKIQDDYDKKHSGIGGFFTTVGEKVTGFFTGKDGKPPQINIPDMQPWVANKKKAEETIAKAKAALGKPNHDKQTIAELQTALGDSNNDFQVIIDKLGQFANVWAMVRHDLQQVDEGLKANISGGATLPILFTIRLKTVETQYNAFKDCMAAYQTTVTPIGEPTEPDRMPPDGQQ